MGGMFENETNLNIVNSILPARALNSIALTTVHITPPRQPVLHLVATPRGPGFIRARQSGER